MNNVPTAIQNLSFHLHSSPGMLNDGKWVAKLLWTFDSSTGKILIFYLILLDIHF